MTTQRKDEMPLNQELFDLLEQMTGKVFLHSEMNDIINVVEKYLSPPVPDDVALRHVIDRMRDTITWLNAAGLTVAAEDAETLIRAASTPSAEVRALREALEWTCKRITYLEDTIGGRHVCGIPASVEQALASLPEPKTEKEILEIIMAANEWNDGGMVLSNNARKIISSLREAGCLYVRE